MNRPKVLRTHVLCFRTYILYSLAIELFLLCFRLTYSAPTVGVIIFAFRTLVTSCSLLDLM